MSGARENERAARAFDVVVWGATGFTGRLVAEHLAGREGARIALAGRNRDKLEAVRREIAARVPAAASLPLLVGDAGDPASLHAIAKQTRAVCATVGPFARHGEPVVAACVQSGTDYCDITGEPQFVRRIIDAHDGAARKAGVRIVPTCGFDSVPSDLGVFVLAEHARAHLGRALSSVRGHVINARGGMSGGTLSTMLSILDAAAKDRELRRMLADPYCLSPDREHDLHTDGRDRFAPTWDADAGGWAAPWIMGAINTRVVRRSNALFGHRYGKAFSYRETLLIRGPIKGALGAALVSAAMATSTMALAASPALRRFVAGRLPPGEGPSRESRESGFFELRFHGTLEGDAHPTLLATVTGEGDPGYLATSRMVGEAALCLAQDPPQPAFESGVLTPATAMGMHLVERLSGRGFRFDVTSL